MADLMDAATLRIILLVLGLLLLGAMYLWEVRRSRERAEGGSGNRRRTPRGRRREPRFGDQAGDGAEATLSMRDDAGTASAGRRRSGFGLFDAAPSAVDDVDVSVLDAPDDGASETVEARGEGRAAAAAPRKAQQRSASAGSPAAMAGADEPSLLVQLFVVAEDQAFDGEAVQAAAERQHLVPGEMAIYHRRSLEGADAQARFSMANLVEPGTFPFGSMETFSTPGLALFAQFAGRPSDLMVYDELVQAARSLADELGGEVLLPDRRRFDGRAWERQRGKLLELINRRADSLTNGAERSSSDGIATVSATRLDERGGERGDSRGDQTGPAAATGSESPRRP